MPEGQQVHNSEYSRMQCTLLHTDMGVNWQLDGLEQSVWDSKGENGVQLQWLTWLCVVDPARHEWWQVLILPRSHVGLVI